MEDAQFAALNAHLMHHPVAGDNGLTGGARSLCWLHAGIRKRADCAASTMRRTARGATDTDAYTRVMKQKTETDKPPRGVHPQALATYADLYHKAANRLFPQAREFEPPVYFLYAHAIELALKAFLRSHGEPATGHALRRLLEAAIAKGLRPSRDADNVIELLENVHKDHGFRYFVSRNASCPSIDYVKHVADQLIPAIAAHVRARTCMVRSKGAVWMVFGKPEKKP